MPAPQNFRSAFHGFNREDVVRYLEYINTKHTTELNQLQNEVEYLRSRLESAAPAQESSDLETQCEELRAQVEALTARCAELEACQEGVSSAEELEAYRRAERAERLAKERADLVYHQINGVLADATVKVDGIAGEISTVADRVMDQLNQLQAAVGNSKEALQDAASTLYAIRPNE